MSVEAKIEIIDEIVKRHPHCGVSKGWSWYKGGMTDTGDWHYRKMLDVPYDELKAFLDEIIEQENKKLIPLTEQEQKDSNVFHQYSNGHFINEYTRKQMLKFNEERERKLLHTKYP